MFIKNVCINFYIMHTFCTQNCIFGQKIAIFINFLIFINLANPYKISYLPQHCLYFLPEPHGTHKSAYFSTLIFLKAFICGLFCIFSFHILPLKPSVCGSKSGSKMPFFPHLLSFIAISLYHFCLIISS